ncbi:MAG: 50S ribosomal protein L29 [Patescibacteria group bacterium]
MKIKEIRTKSVSELDQLLKELRHKFDDLNFKVKQKQIKNIREIRATRRNIAKVLTVLREKK